MAAPAEVWTCETCGRRARGTGDEGLWPPAGWEAADAGALVGHCDEHRRPAPGDDAAREDHRWFSAGA